MPEPTARVRNLRVLFLVLVTTTLAMAWPDPVIAVLSGAIFGLQVPVLVDPWLERHLFKR